MKGICELAPPIDELKELLSSFEGLEFGDNTTRDLLMRRAGMLTRTTFGESSSQAKELQNTSFNLLIARPSTLSEEVRRRSWQSKINQMVNFLTVLIEELEMGSVQRTRANKKSNRVFIVHGH